MKLTIFMKHLSFLRFLCLILFLTFQYAASSQTFGYSFGSDIQYALDPVTISILAGSTVTYSIY